MGARPDKISGLLSQSVKIFTFYTIFGDQLPVITSKTLGNEGGNEIRITNIIFFDLPWVTVSSCPYQQLPSLSIPSFYYRFQLFYIQFYILSLYYQHSSSSYSV